MVHLDATGTGQTAKLFNNALLMMNQAAIAESVKFVLGAGMEPLRLFEALKLGSAASRALTLLNTMLTPDTVGHLSAVEAEDMHSVQAAIRSTSVTPSAQRSRGRS